MSGKSCTSPAQTGKTIRAALMVPIAMAPMALQAADHKTVRTYHDKQHNDDHQWNSQEDRAWGWRHDHSDEQLKIVIH